MGPVPPAMEHPDLRGGHNAEEQDHVVVTEFHKLHLPGDRVLGVSTKGVDTARHLQ